MFRKSIHIALGLALAGLPLAVGCDRTIEERREVEKKPDGTTKVEEKKVTEKSDGTIKVEEKTERK